MTISDEAVEAAAKAWHLSRWPEAPWELLNDDSQAYGRTHALAALEAAAPFIRAEALEEAAGGLRHDPQTGTEWVNATWLRARAAEMRQG